MGLLLAAVSVTGFLTAANALDERIPVLVTAVDIERGDVIDPSVLTWTRASPGTIPFVPWSPEAAESYSGAIARWRIPAGSLLTDEAVEWPALDGATLGLQIRLDTSLTTETLDNGDQALLIDPGIVPAAGEPGRPRRVIRSFFVENWDGAQMTLQLPPDEYLRWQSDLLEADGYFLAVPVALGADPGAAAAALDEAWRLEHAALVEADEQAQQLLAGPQPDPGQFEARIPVDLSLAPAGVVSGELVLLVDPGSAPSEDDDGRPRSVLQPLVIDYLDAGDVVVFAPAEEWIAWQQLVERLAGPALVIPVPAGTDAENLAERLDAAWLEDWRDDIEAR